MAQVDPSLLMGGLESGSVPIWQPITTSFTDAWATDPRAVWSSFAMIIFSEIGDKTFLIAAILAMRQSRLVVFLGAFASLAIMSVLSALMGVMFPSLLPKELTTFMAAVLFFVFGAKMMREGLAMTGDEMEEEWEEAEREIREEEDGHEMDTLEQGQANGSSNAHSATNGGYPSVTPYPSTTIGKEGPSEEVQGSEATTQKGPPRSYTGGLKDGAKNLCGLCFSPVFAQAFVLTFLGEWGDRSQIATIALAAAHNVALVSFGTIVGHALCTTLAVLGGGWLATRISVKKVTLGGAALFLLFGIIYLYESLSSGSLVSSGVAAGNPMLGQGLAASPPGGAADGSRLDTGAGLGGLLGGAIGGSP